MKAMVSEFNERFDAGTAQFKISLQIFISAKHMEDSEVTVSHLVV